MSNLPQHLGPVIFDQPRSSVLANGRFIMGPGFVVADYVEWLRDELERATTLDQDEVMVREYAITTPMPVPTAVYCAVQDGVIVYVGIATNFERRVAQHRRRSAWATEDVEFTLYCTSPSRRAALDLERKMIEEMQPANNTYLTERDHRMVKS